MDLIADINNRLEYVTSQVNIGGSKVDVIQEQADALLSTFSTYARMDMKTITMVSGRLVETPFTPSQLAAFSACMRMAASKKPRQDLHHKRYPNKQIRRILLIGV